MEYGNIVMLAFGPFLDLVSGKDREPVERGIAQTTRTSFLHVRITVFELSGLVGRGRHPSIGQQFVRGTKAGKAAGFSEDHRSHSVSNVRDV